jgi:hypothetical protein
LISRDQAAARIWATGAGVSGCALSQSRAALRTTDLGVAHLFSDLTAHLRGIPVTAHRGDVEPLVRLHKINRHTRASGKDHAKAEAIFGICWLGAPRRHFHVRHRNPLLSPPMCLKAQRTATCCSNTLVRTALIFGIKFEWQFK